MRSYFYDRTTDTVRRYEYLAGGLTVGERFSKKHREWSSECCRLSACRWDQELSEEVALEVIARQSKAFVRTGMKK